MNSRFFQLIIPTLSLAAATLGPAAAQETAPAAAPAKAGPVLLTIKAGEPAAKLSPMFYGLMTEEINYSYDGGLYAELVNNRTFKDRRDPLRYWKLVQTEGAGNSISVVTDQPLNDVLTNSLKLEATAATADKPVGIANEGFWGIPVTPETRYRASFYARAADGFTGPLTIELSGASAVLASAKVSGLGVAWKKFEVTLTTGSAQASKENHLVIS